jgi:Ca2+-binding RTX toxin-like protein
MEDTSAIINGTPLMPGAASVVNVEIISEIVLSRFNDSLIVGGDFVGGHIYAGDGNDYVVGQGGPADPPDWAGPMVEGQGGADILIGSFAGDYLAGGEGEDYLHGGSGHDTLYADEIFGPDRRLDRDRLNGGPGDDYLYFGWGDEADGGEGFDTAIISFAAATNGVSVDTGSAYQSIERIFSLQLSSYDDLVIIGTTEAVTPVDASFGNDTVIGQASSIHVNGSEGDDLLVGSTANDLLVGGAGNDRLIGGLGRDELWGREGADRFYFSTAEFGDRIADFQGQLDKIDLTAIDANALTSGTQEFVFIGEAPFSGLAGQLRVYSGANNTYFVEGDVDGDKAADLRIVVGFYDTPAPLIETDFLLGSSGAGHWDY